MKHSLALCALLSFASSISLSAQTPAQAVEQIQQLSHTELALLVEKLTTETESNVETQQEAHMVLEAIMGIGTLSTLLFVVVITNAFLSGKISGEELFAMVDYKGLGFDPRENVKSN